MLTIKVITSDDPHRRVQPVSIGKRAHGSPDTARIEVIQVAADQDDIFEIKRNGSSKYGSQFAEIVKTVKDQMISFSCFF